MKQRRCPGSPIPHVWNLKSKLGFEFLSRIELEMILRAERKRHELWDLPPQTATYSYGTICDLCGKTIFIGLDNWRVCDGWITKLGKKLCNDCLSEEEKADKQRYVEHWKEGNKGLRLNICQ